MKKYIKIFLIVFIIIFIIEYLFGAFIAFDFNLTNWLLFNTAIGRVVFILILIANIQISSRTSDEINNINT